MCSNNKEPRRKIKEVEGTEGEGEGRWVGRVENCGKMKENLERILFFLLLYFVCICVFVVVCVSGIWSSITPDCTQTPKLSSTIFFLLLLLFFVLFIFIIFIFHLFSTNIFFVVLQQQQQQQRKVPPTASETCLN